MAAADEREEVVKAQLPQESWAETNSSDLLHQRPLPEPKH